jgi:hypothetical protein
LRSVMQPQKTQKNSMTTMPSTIPNSRIAPVPWRSLRSGSNGGVAFVGAGVSGSVVRGGAGVGLAAVTV